jgi:hypothetical protein
VPDESELQAVEEIGAETEAVEQAEPAEASAPTEEGTDEQSAPPSPRYKFKVLDEEREIDHEEAQRLINLGHYNERGREAFQKGAELRRAAEFVTGRLVEDLVPNAIDLFAGKLGLSPAEAKAAVRQQVEAWLGRELEEEYAAPEEKRKLELERELASTKQRLAAREAREQAAQQEEEWATTLNEFDGEFAKQGVADDSLSIRLLEGVFHDAVDEGIRLTPAQFVARVKAEREKLVGSALSKATTDDLRRGAPESLKQVRQEDIARVRAARSQQAGAPKGNSQPTKPARHPRRVVSMAEMHQELDQL